MGNRVSALFNLTGKGRPILNLLVIYLLKMQLVELIRILPAQEICSERLRNIVPPDSSMKPGKSGDNSSSF